jgi:membrane-bound lytic murein transglycosylase C
MNIFRNILIILLALVLPALLLSYQQGGVSNFGKKAKLSEQALANERQQYFKQVEAGLKDYHETYQQEFKTYSEKIVSQWGEFKDSGPSVWVSYADSEQVRRSVDFNNGEVQVDMLVDKGTKIKQVKQELDKAVFRLMNTTQKQAYQSDVVANRVEQKLSRYGDLVERAELTDQRLFSMDDMVSIQINHDGFFKVSNHDKNVAITDVLTSAKKGKDIIRVSFKVSHSIHEKAMKYAATVTEAAKNEEINDELIYAIMETESSFNPLAKSPIPAYGLMQIVPYTAGKDATNYLYGKPKILAPSYLFKPENNIAIGAAYLHVLHYKYLRRVTDEASRIYCAIAAYNTGASNVAKAFIDQASFNRAVPEINKLSAEQVYSKLRKYLPRKETREYVEKVSRRMEKYL